MTEKKLPDMSKSLHMGLEFEGSILEAGGRIREQSKTAYGSDLLDARWCLVSSLAALISIKAGVPGATNRAISDRLVLVVTFAQGFPIAETLISEGQYIKAAAVLKQDYETIARLSEVRAGKAKAGTQPNVKHAPAGSQRYYGELNAVAHPAREDILADLLAKLNRGEVNGVSPIPEFNQEVARSLYELHVFTLLEIVREALQLYIEMYPGDLEAAAPAFELFHTALGFVERAGFRRIAIKEDPNA